ncbi:hypothetical protein [Hymenobacter armeniacus]|uniref:Uncharacterized protein n=1 Tax=Hymenobacter armeniacus TaxID=2771358 RepID=A0ABR8JRX5_9BACT|nr:hypothetical protein [Hymenobacter armeniacus]MBD2722734.1 hypothetical protein [Hymenobacter armeniacus]
MVTLDYRILRTALGYSFLGGVFLLMAYATGPVLHYLGGYVILLSYITIIWLLIANMNKKRIALGLAKRALLVVSVLMGMTVIYALTLSFARLQLGYF